MSSTPIGKLGSKRRSRAQVSSVLPGHTAAVPWPRIHGDRRCTNRPRLLSAAKLPCTAWLMMARGPATKPLWRKATFRQSRLTVSRRLRSTVKNGGRGGKSTTTLTTTWCSGVAGGCCSMCGKRPNTTPAVRCFTSRTWKLSSQPAGTAAPGTPTAR